VSAAYAATAAGGSRGGPRRIAHMPPFILVAVGGRDDY